MDLQEIVKRIVRVLAGLLVPLSLFLGGIGVVTGSVVLIVFGVLGAGFGAGVYWGAGRYEEQIESVSNWEADFTTGRIQLLTLFQLVITIIAFVLLSWLAGQFDLVTSTGVNEAQPPPIFMVISVGLGAFLGGAVPYLIQYNEFVHQLNDSTATRIGGQFLTFGTLVGLLVLDLGVALVYMITYVGSRFTVLLGFFVRSRL